MKKLIPILLISFALLVYTSIPGRAQEEPTPEADPIREKVKEKVEAARHNPKAAIGTLRDKTADTLEIESTNGEIVQSSVAEDTTFVDIKDTPKTIDFEDIGIGDFVIAMGFQNGDNVLEARRVLLTNTPKTPTRKAIYGTITNYETGEITVKEKQTDTEYLVSAVRGAEITMQVEDESKKISFSEIEEGDTVIVSGSYEDQELNARVIKVVSRPESTEE